jgi:hypothetical protein
MDTKQVVRERICLLLRQYPYLSLSMIAAHVRPYDVRGWRDTLEELVSAGTVVRQEQRVPTRGGGRRWVTVYRLAG